MEQKEKKTYVANFKPIGNSAGLKGRVYINPEHIETDQRGKQFIPIVIWPNREPDQYGNTHAALLDTFKPNKDFNKDNQTSNNNLPF